MARKNYRMKDLRWQSRQATTAFFRSAVLDAPWQGAVSLTVIGEMARPMIVPSPNGPITAVGPGYHWLQFAPRDEHWWLTAMYNERQELVQFYFDLTFQNHILPEGESWCEDAWLDLIIEPDGTARLLDEAELSAALASGEVSREEYERVLAAAESLRSRYAGRAAELDAITRPWIRRLLSINH